MNAGIFAEWLRCQGYTVKKTESSYWYNAFPKVYQAFPYNWLIDPSEEELRELLCENRAIALRYSTKLEKPIGHISYHIVYNKDSYSLNDLKSTHRRNARIGLKNCIVEPISFERMAEEGFYLELDTLKRQKRKGRLDKKSWRNRFLSASELPGFEPWGAIVDGRLAATIFTFQAEDCCHLLFHQSNRKYLKARVNNALTFEVTKSMVERKKNWLLNYGLHSLDAPQSVDNFKFRMGYEPMEVRQRVVFHPSLKKFINKLSYKGVVQLLKFNKESHILAKAEGMTRFYLEGKLKIEMQKWPQCLIDRKQSLLKY